jgi:transposase
MLAIDREWKGIQPWQWRRMCWLFPDKPKPFLRKRRKGGRPRSDDRKCLEAIFWSARTGFSLRRVPARFGRPRTAERRFALWYPSSVLERAWKCYLQQTGGVEREEWRRDLVVACKRSTAFWRLELQSILEMEWPREKSVILDACAESSPWRGGLTPPN